MYLLTDKQMDGLGKSASPIDLEHAVQRNLHYGKVLQWQPKLGAIMRLVDFSPRLSGLIWENLKSFAEAVAKWQQEQRISPPDGIIGPKTWAKMQLLIPDTIQPAPSAQPSGSLNLIPLESPGGGRLKDKSELKASDQVTFKRYTGTETVPLHRLAASAWAALISAARMDGIAEPLLLPSSGYRSDQRQAKAWAKALKKYGTKELARKWVAPPGNSAHRTGRAIDCWLGLRNGSENVTKLRRQPAYQWLVKNASRFGFYPYSAEPWHWEYNPPNLG